MFALGYKDKKPQNRNMVVLAYVNQQQDAKVGFYWAVLNFEQRRHSAQPYRGKVLRWNQMMT